MTEPRRSINASAASVGKECTVFEKSGAYLKYAPFIIQFTPFISFAPFISLPPKIKPFAVKENVMIADNVKEILSEISAGNNLGEPITLVGATKFRTAEEINEAIAAGMTDAGENKAQEFRDKSPLLKPVNYHFFGRLQKNKIKYLIGKCYLIQSVDSIELLNEINRQSEQKGIIQNVLLEVNLGEEQKGGFPLNAVYDALKSACELKNVKVLGFMAMLPEFGEESYFITLLDNLRKLYDEYKGVYGFKYLSVGMSGDYPLTIKHGANMIRVGTKIFGKRY